MKSLTITAPDEVFGAAIEALCVKGDWLRKGDLEKGDKVGFAQGVLMDFIGECIHGMEISKVREALNKQQQAATEQIQAANSASRDSVKFEVV